MRSSQIRWQGGLCGYLLVAVLIGGEHRVWAAPEAEAKTALRDDHDPQAEPVFADASLADVEAAITRGVDFLVKSQNSNGSWGGPTLTKGLNIYAPVPGAHHAFRAGASGLALSGLLDAGDDRDEVELAIGRAAKWVQSELPKLRRADPTTTYNNWGHAYGLRAITRLYQHETSQAKKVEWVKLGQQQVELANRFADINGGWGYLDLFDDLRTKRPSGITTAFMSASMLLAMREAHEEMGVKLNHLIVRAAVKSIQLQRTPDFSYVYSYGHHMHPRSPINRPAGSLARSQACNATLRLYGDDAVSDDVLREWLDRFIKREGWLSIGRKRPVPHETHFQISGYFYYYGIYYFSESARLLPKEEQAKYAKALAGILLARQESDGSWWDYPLYNYHQPYGTGYALMALAWCRDSLKADSSSGSKPPAVVEP